MIFFLFPGGLTCGTEINREFCPTSGESGSLLMVNDPKQPYKYRAEGILREVIQIDIYKYTKKASL